jgi:thiol-disulfide isomerase/thioredoxin
MRPKALFVALVAMTLLAGGSAAAQEGGLCDPKPKAAKFDFTLKDADGKPVKLANFKGKLIVLNFWATWCVPCRAEIPTLVGLQTKYGAQGLQVIGVSIDDPVEKMKPFVGKYKINYPALTAFNNDGILDAYGPMVVVPWSVIIKRDGNACVKHIGPVTKEAFEREIKGLL